MPIRFRCAYCNQLLGISRRKAGTVVRCPGCAGQVVVPSLEDAGLSDKNLPKPPAGSPGAFEGNDIDRMLEGTAGEQPSVIHPGPLPPNQYASSQPHANPPPGPPTTTPITAPPTHVKAPGFVLSPARATLLSVGVVVALAIAFGSGLLVGLMLGMRK
jgi:hypothetical protein